jgi:hypothetical protein
MAQHGASYTDEEVKTLTAYLSRHFGRVHMNRATVDDLKAVLELTDQQAAAVVAARADGRKLHLDGRCAVGARPRSRIPRGTRDAYLLHRPAAAAV